MVPRKKILPRGIRNRNPLNIRIGNVWLGEVKNPDDPQFEQFVSMDYGLRAGFVLLRRYIRHYHHDTIRKIITAWAPPVENTTSLYIQTVGQMAGIDVDAQLDYYDMGVMCKIVDAMCFVENGMHVDFSLIEKAYTMA